MNNLDEIDCKILNLLQKNCRISLTDISKNVNLSVDSVKKRVDKLIKLEIFYPKIQLRPGYFGYKNVLEIKIKLHNNSEKETVDFIEYLKNSPYIVELISISGYADYTVVIIAKNSVEMGKLTSKIRMMFSKIIDQWNESLTTRVYKFEEYDMNKLKEEFE